MKIWKNGIKSNHIIDNKKLKTKGVVYKYKVSLREYFLILNNMNNLKYLTI